MTKKILIAGCAALALAGCTTVRTSPQPPGTTPPPVSGGITGTICANQTAIRIGLLAALQAAQLIVEPVAREAAISAIRVSKAAVDRCPPE